MVYASTCIIEIRVNLLLHATVYDLGDCAELAPPNGSLQQRKSKVWSLEVYTSAESHFGPILRCLLTKRKEVRRMEFKKGC
ncbi:hypothetical protein NC651_033938 [Populus alba x Populus x berolinensis]|nr:hypothetical protein NC651_033938 [Populus alba x Populus x berolinensis]